jgi:aconitase A
MRDAVSELGGDPANMNPLIPVVLTIDHSVIVEHYASPDAVEANLDIDYRRNSERYRFIKWVEQSVDNFRVVPPGTGIIHPGQHGVPRASGVGEQDAFRSSPAATRTTWSPPTATRR